MQQDKMKNMIVLKNLPSNIVDEAIIILKDNKKIKTLERVEKQEKTEEPKQKREEYIVKEAEMVISNFLSKIEKEKQQKSYSTRKVELKYKRLKIVVAILSTITILNGIIALAH